MLLTNYAINNKKNSANLWYIRGLPSLFIYCLLRRPETSATIYTLHRCCRCHEPAVDAAAHTEEEHSDGAEGEGCAGGAVALERGKRSVGLVDVHALHNLQVVVE